MPLIYNPVMKSLAEWCKEKGVPIGNFTEEAGKMLTEEDFDNLDSGVSGDFTPPEREESVKPDEVAVTPKPKKRVVKKRAKKKSNG